MTTIDSRSTWPHYWPDPGSARKRFEFQQHYRNCPWGEVQEPADVKQEREARELRMRGWNSTWRFVPSGIVRPTDHLRGLPVEPSPAVGAPNMAEAEKAGIQRVVQKLLKEHGNTPDTHRAIEAAGVEVGPAANDLEREATAIEEAVHAVQADELGLRVAELFVTKSGTGSCKQGRLNACNRGRGWRDTAVRLAAYYIAGQVGQRIKYGRIVTGGHQQDNENIERYLVVAGSEQDAVRAEAEQLAETTLRARWPEVEAVAAALQEHGMVSAEKFYSLIQSRAITQTRRVELPLHTRALEVRSSSFDEAAGTIQVIWGSGARVKRADYAGQYWEDLPAANADLTWMNSGKCPLLDSHNNARIGDVLGAVVAGSAYVRDGKGYATIRLSSKAPVADIRAGTLKNISIGYRVIKMRQLAAGDDDIPVMRVDAYEILECSIVGLPADKGAEIRKFDCELQMAA